MENPAPRRIRSRAIVLIIAGAVFIALGQAFGFLRAAVGLAVLMALLVFGFKYWRDVGLIPPEPEVTDVSDFDLKYVCRVCGLELRVEVAAKDKAPTHCGEPMELVSGGTPPLRPV